MGRRAGVEVPISSAWRLIRSAGGLERSVQGAVVEGTAGRRSGQMGRRHGLLGLERWTRAEHAGAGGPEGHGPRLHHALPGVVARSPRRGRVGVVGALPAAVPTATSAAAIRTTAGARVAAAGGGSRRCGGGGAVLVAGRQIGGPTGRVVVRRGECLASLSSRIMLNAELFEDEEGASTLEGMRRVLGGDRRPDVAVPGVEAAEEVQDLTRLGDRVPMSRS